MRSIYRRALLSAVLPLSLACSSVMADTLPATGLGQSWPNAVDLSASPHYHVYAFQKQGVRFVQVNDTSGTVRGAIGYSDANVLELPVGVDAAHWVVSNGASIPAAMPGSEQVYSDEAVTIRVAPQADGSVKLLADPSDCKNPAECSVKGP